MKKLLSILFVLAITMGLAAAAHADQKEELKIYHLDDGVSVAGVLEDGELSGWCAVYMSGEYEGCAFWGFFEDGKASGFLCMPDGTYKMHTFDDLKFPEEKSMPEESNTTPQKDEKKVSVGMQNALKSAHNYLNYTAFSYKGLIKQLEYEKYSNAEATYAADNCGADWNEQAYLKAKQYLDYTSFSKDGLIKQLEYEGFTHSQAVYAVNKCGY